MGLMADALTDQAIQTRKGPPCTTGAFIATLSQQDRQEVLDAFDSTLHTSVIFRALQKLYPDASRTSVGKHRNGDCQCPKLAPETVPASKRPAPKPKPAVKRKARKA